MKPPGQYEYGRLRRRGSDAADKFFQQRDASGFHQNNVHAVTFDSVEQCLDFSRVVLSNALFDGKPHGQVLNAGVGLIPHCPIRITNAAVRGTMISLISPPKFPYRPAEALRPPD